MQIQITKPGVFSTVQDMGRRQYLSQAVPVSGAMDTLSARIANIAVGNLENEAVIEFTYAAAEFVATSDILIAYAGDGSIFKSGDNIIPTERPVFIPQGRVIRLVNNPAGSRTYLAIACGWDIPEVLGSKSTYVTAGIGGFNGRALQAGDILSNTKKCSAATDNFFLKLQGTAIKYPKWNITRQALLPVNKKIIRVVPAHEFTWFDGCSIYDFLSSPYTLSLQSNRMGYHLNGVPIQRLVQKELLSTAVTPGTIQITGSGTPVLLMADCQTTGGYPRIAQVAAVDLPLCGQLKPGDIIFFKETSRHEAEMLYIEREEHLSKLALAVRSQF